MISAEQQSEFASYLRADEALSQLLAAAALHIAEGSGSQEKKKKGPKTLMNFFHPFSTELPALLKKYDALPPQQRYEMVRFELVGLLTHQLTSFVKEHLRVPFTDTVLRIDVQPDSLTAYDPRYPHGDVFEQGRRAVGFAQANGYEAYEKRYALELEQLSELIKTIPHAVLKAMQELPQEAQRELPRGWETYRRPLPSELCAQCRIPDSTPAYIGPQMFTIFPQNHETYKEAMAFWCMYSVIYIPSLPKGNQFHLILSQYFNDFGYQEHREALTKVGQTPNKTLSSRPGEAELMRYIAIPDASFQSLDQVSMIAEIATRLGKGKKVDKALKKQQETIGEFEKRFEYIVPAAEYLADVFFAEYRRVQTGQSTPEEVEAVINFAAEIPLSTFIKGDLFDRNLAIQKYRDSFETQTRQFSLDPKKRKKELGTQRNAFIASFANTSMSGVLKRSFSLVDCSFGTFGGLSQGEGLISTLSQSNLLQRFGSTDRMVSFFKSGQVTANDLRSAIGDRAENFGPGKCVACHHPTLVGECGLCYGCELGIGLNHRETMNLLPKAQSKPAEKEPRRVEVPQKSSIIDQPPIGMNDFLFGFLSPASVWGPQTPVL